MVGNWGDGAGVGGRVVTRAGSTASTGPDQDGGAGAGAGSEEGGRVTGYEVWFDPGSGVTEPGCIERAIKIAEEQDVKCEVVGG